jgi:dCMP deaminase
MLYEVASFQPAPPPMNDFDFLRLAYAEAQKSKDRSTQNGAVLVDPDTTQVVACGHNDLHWEFQDTDERRVRPLKYEWTEHAERHAIFDAALRGVATNGLWMYCPWFACADCGRAIVYAGIRKVIGHSIPQHQTRPDWAKSIATADQMLQEANVEVVRLTGELGVTFRFDGKDIQV